MTVAARATVEEDLGASVVACGDPSPVIEPAEHDLDPVVALVAPLVVADGRSTRLPTRGARANPLDFERFRIHPVL